MIHRQQLTSFCIFTLAISPRWSRLLGLWALLMGASATAQQDSIFIQMKMDTLHKVVHISQRLVYKNKLNHPVDTIKLLAWANAYRKANTPMGKRKLEERDRDFYFAKKKERGWIQNLDFKGGEVINLSDEKSENIYLRLNQPLPKNQTLSIDFSYEVKLPSADFTGYGYARGNKLLKYFFIVPDSFDEGQLKPRYFLDIEDNQSIGNYWDIQLENTEIYAQSNLAEIAPNHFSGYLTDDPVVAISANQALKLIQSIDGQQVTLHLGFSTTEEERAYIKFYAPLELKFIKDRLGFLPDKIFLSQHIKENEGFLGSDDITFRKWRFKIFNQAAKIDLNLFSMISAEVMQQYLMADYNKNHWLYNGLKTYLEIEYLKANYSDEKLLGRLPDEIRLWKIKPLKWFHAADLKLLDRYGLVYQYILNENLDQKISTPLKNLSKFNVLAVSHFEVGLIFDMLAEKVNKSQFNRFLKSYFSKRKGSIVEGADFIDEMISALGPSAAFFKDFIQTKNRVNLHLQSAEPNGQGGLNMIVEKNTNLTLPFKVEVTDDKGEKNTYYLNAQKPEELYELSENKVEKIAINTRYAFPETNFRDNYIYTRGTLVNNKKLLFQFMRDVPNPEYNEIFWVPRLSWNDYDKLILGLELTNKSLLPPNFIYKLVPTFSTGTTSLTGSAGVSYDWKPADAFFSNWSFGSSASYYHYDIDLAYKTFNLATVLKFAKNPRSQISRSLSFSYNYFEKQLTPQLEKAGAYGKYNLWNVGYSYVDNKAIHENYFTTNFQWMEDFQKLSAEYYYRWEYAKGKKLMLRLFGGYFLSNHTRNDLFNFGISRVSNYAFNYGLLGQSATEGVLSQQFVLAEGGFKSSFNTRVNQWLFTANVSANLWKMFGVYADAGVFKNKYSRPKFVWDSGIKVDVIPDFLEIYFPMQSSNGFEPAQDKYFSRIRYTLNLSLSAIINYFRRGVY